MAVKPIPDGYHTVTPYLIVHDAAKALDFYKKALGARELFRMAVPDGRVGHAEMQVGNSRFMLADECPEMGAKSATTLGGTPVSVYLYVEDADASFDRAVTAGATVVHPMKDQFYGDRSGTVADPFGLQWHIATHKEDVAPDELHRRAAAAMKQKSG